METETRSLPSEIAGDGRTLTGLIPYNAPTRLTLGGRAMTEVIRPGAFARVVAEKRDVIATFNHDPNRMLGRTSSGTLTLTDTPEGLRFAVTLPESAGDVRELVARGDLKGASFTFTQRSRSAVAGETRELLDLDVIEVGPVVFPAYGQSSVAMRSADGTPPASRARAVEGIMKRAGI